MFFIPGPLIALATFPGVNCPRIGSSTVLPLVSDTRS
jgi:hypothetical protein